MMNEVVKEVIAVVARGVAVVAGIIFFIGWAMDPTAFGESAIRAVEAGWSWLWLGGL
jgi:hypothetical protein